MNFNILSNNNTESPTKPIIKEALSPDDKIETLKSEEETKGKEKEKDTS